MPPSAQPITPSWYFAAQSRHVAHRHSHTSVAGHGLLRLERAVDGALLARLDGVAVPAVERGGMVFVWFGSPSPSFELPGWSMAESSALSFTHKDARTTPDIVMRDLADLAHFTTVHGYGYARTREALRARGSQLSTQVEFGWDTGIPGLFVPARFTATLYGVGLQINEVTSLKDAMVSRHFIMPTPSTPGHVRVHLALGMRLQGPARLGGPALLRAAHMFTMASFHRDVGRDARLWEGLDAHEPADNDDLTLYQRWLGDLQRPAQEASA